MQPIEDLIEEIVQRLKQNADLSIYKKNRKISPFISLLEQLSKFPKSAAPKADFARVKNQILSRIVVPKAETKKSSWLPKFFSISASIIGGFLLVVGLTLGVAITALNSGPGQAVYPLKKIVENVQLQLAPADQKQDLQIKFATNRVEELEQVLQKQQTGQISAKDAQKFVAATIQDLQTTTTAAAQSTQKQPTPTVVNNLGDLSAKLQVASTQTQGEVKMELQQAIQTTNDSQAEAIKNIEQAGIKVEDNTIIDNNSVTASGQLTDVSAASVSIGSAKFLINSDTKYDNPSTVLTVGQTVQILGEIKDNKTYADKITVIPDSKTDSSSNNQTDPTQSSQPQSSPTNTNSKTDTPATTTNNTDTQQVH
jgi:hypothetical protein